MSLDPSFLKQLTTFAVGFSAAFIAALWLSLIFWTNRDIRKRSRDRALRILAVVVVTVFFLPGFLIYLVLRPGRTLEEEYQRSLEEEALLQAIEGAALCPGCERHVQPDWIVCPGCGTVLKKTCLSCGHLIDLPWNICPFCATVVPGMPLEEPENEFSIDSEYSNEGLNTSDAEFDDEENEIQPELDDEFKSQP